MPGSFCPRTTVTLSLDLFLVWDSLKLGYVPFLIFRLVCLELPLLRLSISRRGQVMSEYEIIKMFKRSWRLGCLKILILLNSQ